MLALYLVGVILLVAFVMGWTWLISLLLGDAPLGVSLGHWAIVVAIVSTAIIMDKPR